jgi:hypothetical protein
MLYIATIMPFQIFFVYNTTNHGWAVMEILLTTVFAIDIAVTVNLAYVLLLSSISYTSGHGWPRATTTGWVEAASDASSLFAVGFVGVPLTALSTLMATSLVVVAEY